MPFGLARKTRKKLLDALDEAVIFAGYKDILNDFTAFHQTFKTSIFSLNPNHKESISSFMLQPLVGKFEITAELQSFLLRGWTKHDIINYALRPAGLIIIAVSDLQLRTQVFIVLIFT